MSVRAILLLKEINLHAVRKNGYPRDALFLMQICLCYKFSLLSETSALRYPPRYDREFLLSMFPIPLKLVLLSDALQLLVLFIVLLVHLKPRQLPLIIVIIS
jgi:hypothetical protein